MWEYESVASSSAISATVGAFPDASVTATSVSAWDALNNSKKNKKGKHANKPTAAVDEWIAGNRSRFEAFAHQLHLPRPNEYIPDNFNLVVTAGCGSSATSTEACSAVATTMTTTTTGGSMSTAATDACDNTVGLHGDIGFLQVCRRVMYNAASLSPPLQFGHLFNSLVSFV